MKTLETALGIHDRERRPPDISSLPRQQQYPDADTEREPAGNGEDRGSSPARSAHLDRVPSAMGETFLRLVLHPKKKSHEELNSSSSSPAKQGYRQSVANGGFSVSFELSA